MTIGAVAALLTAATLAIILYNSRALPLRGYMTDHREHVALQLQPKYC